MLFNSVEFLLFFPAVLLLYAALPLRGQNLMLLAASYFFYGLWDWRFLGLIVLSTFIDYYCAQKIQRHFNTPRARPFLVFSMAANLALLGFFKYCDFFLENLYRLLDTAGMHAPDALLGIAVPVGISFYTFQTMSYTIDVYRGELRAEKSLLDFSLFVAFFPQLVAGPIERASSLLPQIKQARRVRLEQFAGGCHLIFWGLFKKVFIADNLARLIVEPVFDRGLGGGAAMTALGMYAFAYQIYCDFSGYSDIAVGTAKCMGFELCRNFNLPYLAQSPSEFWRRWHVSLSQWLRDYLYILLGGSRAGRTARNLLVTMALGGLWHGAKWTFVVWGVYHGALLVLYRRFAPPPPTPTSRIHTYASMVLMFHLTCLGWLAFRAHDLPHLWSLLGALGDVSFLHDDAPRLALQFAVYLTPLWIVQWHQHRLQTHTVIPRLHWLPRGLCYALLLYALVLFGDFGRHEFIYFQF